MNRVLKGTLMKSMLSLLLACVALLGQGFSPVEARIASVSGPVFVAVAPGQPSTAATRGVALSPGTVVDTRSGGRAVISLTDGSMVVVQPGSTVIFKDFRQAASLRELFEITLGQVRVKINHFAGRPNPYRMNSPTASIAVRGTEFSITVDATGATRVVVFEGEVEVVSRSDPSRQVLIDSGHGVLLAPGFDLQMYTPSARELDERARGGNGGNAGQQGPGGDHDQPGARSQAGTYERYIAGLESLNGLPLLLRYNAIPEAYLDSAENPAYATAFRQPEARLYLLPSLGVTPEALENPTGAGESAVPSDFQLSSQFSGFAPLAGGRLVLGASATGSYINTATGSTAAGLGDPSASGPIPSVASVVSKGKSTSRFVDGSLLLASKFGGNSFGLQVEALRGNGSQTSTTPDPDASGVTLRDSLTRSDISQTRITIGWKRDLAARHTLGMFARYGFIEAKTQDVFSLVRGASQPLTQTASPGHSAEIGLRLRGEIRPGLYYGLETAWFGLSLQDAFTANAILASQRDREHKESAGFGLAWTPWKQTVLAADLAAGLSCIGAMRSQNGLLLQNGNASGHFESLHIAVQREFRSRYFLIASFVNVWQGNSLKYSVYPSESGGEQPLSDSLFSTSPSAYYSAPRLSDFGGGVRLSKDLLAQYIFSTDYGYSSSSQTLMLRYTFRKHM
jgi:hypothetical protein